ncbi:MAG: methyltransferase domain-containing protein [Actinobacteria bacterium]|nr:methyltransferase domain-containing protein [Actinomycetota bacterium]
MRQRLRRLRRPAWLGTIRRTTPLSDHWGFDRGTPVDRYYIERFMAQESQRIRGRVLEVADSGYTRRFGHGVERSDILDIDASNPAATFVADLAAADALPSDTFDCFILTQTLQYVFDLQGAVRHVHRILRPGGAVLCTVPAVSRIGRRYLETEYWRFTAASSSRLFREAFGDGAVEVRARGNVLACVAFLMGMACEELSARELESDDEFFPLVVTIRASKAAGRTSAGVPL